MSTRLTKLQRAILDELDRYGSAGCHDDELAKAIGKPIKSVRCSLTNIHRRRLVVRGPFGKHGEGWHHWYHPDHLERKEMPLPGPTSIVELKAAVQLTLVTTEPLDVVQMNRTFQNPFDYGCPHVLLHNQQNEQDRGLETEWISVSQQQSVFDILSEVPEEATEQETASLARLRLVPLYWYQADVKIAKWDVISLQKVASWAYQHYPECILLCTGPIVDDKLTMLTRNYCKHRYDAFVNNIEVTIDSD